MVPSVRYRTSGEDTCSLFLTLPPPPNAIENRGTPQAVPCIQCAKKGLVCKKDEGVSILYGYCVSSTMVEDRRGLSCRRARERRGVERV